MVVVGDEAARGQPKPFKDARTPRSRGEATPPVLLRPRRNDEDDVGIVTFDVVEDAVDLMKVGEHALIGRTTMKIELLARRRLLGSFWI
jgi:hypothetical protein